MLASVRVRRWFLAALLITAALPAHAAAQQCSGQWGSSATVAPSNIRFSTPTFVDLWGNSSVQFTMRMRLDWDADPPGTYGTNLRFTITS